jgi:hypothetical protein
MDENLKDGVNVRLHRHEGILLQYQLAGRKLWAAGMSSEHACQVVAEFRAWERDDPSPHAVVAPRQWFSDCWQMREPVCTLSLYGVEFDLSPAEAEAMVTEIERLVK